MCEWCFGSKATNYVRSKKSGTRIAVCDLCAADIASPKTVCSVCMTNQSLVGLKRRTLPMCRSCMSLWMTGDDCDVCRSSGSAVALLQFGDKLAVRACADCMVSYSDRCTRCFQCKSKKPLSELQVVDQMLQAVRLCSLCKWQHETAPKKVPTAAPFAGVRLARRLSLRRRCFFTQNFALSRSFLSATFF